MTWTPANARILALALLLLRAGPSWGQQPAAGPATPGQAVVATPRDPKAPVAGTADGRGPTGPVQLRILSPKPGEELPLPQDPASGATVHVVLELKNYETFLDPATKTGQAVALFLDSLPYYPDHDPSKPWAFRKLAPGTHTLRAVPIRPWGEPIREEGAFASVTFSVGPRAVGSAPAAAEPALTVLRPRFRTRYTAAQAAGLTFDFLVTGCKLSEERGPGTCRVRYRVDGQHEVKLDRAGPVRIEGLTPGRHTFAAGLTLDDKLIPGALTLVQGWFDVEGPGSPAQKPAPPPAS